MMNQYPRFETFLNKQITLTYREGGDVDTVDVDGILGEMNDYGIFLFRDNNWKGTSTGDKFTAKFYPWYNIVNIDLSQGYQPLQKVG